jgi:hypothetical protein
MAIQGFLPGFGSSGQGQPMAATVGPTADQQAEANWQAGQALFQRPGPYTPGVINQLTNRRADQTAAAEAVNVEEARNQAAARGMDPTQAIHQMQQQRQAQNVAFSGDIASQGAVQNFAAETPGRMAAAQAYLNRQITGGTQPAVTSGTAFGGGGGGGGSGGGISNGRTEMGMTFELPQGQNARFVPRPNRQPTVQSPTAQSTKPIAATGAANTIYDPAGGSGYVQNDTNGNRINIVPKPSRPSTTAFSGGYAGNKQYGAVRTYQ